MTGTCLDCTVVVVNKCCCARSSNTTWHGNTALLLQIRLKTLLDTCTYVVFNYTRRGLFDRDKLIVLTLLTFHIMLKVSCTYALAR